MAHSPTRNIQNVSVALYCAGGFPTGFLFQGAASGPQQREETGKGLSCFSLRGPVRHGIVTMEEMSFPDGASCTRLRTHEAGRIRRKASGYITC